MTIKSQEENVNSFGQFFRNKRIQTGLTLRTFCERFGYDPAYISRIERDLLTPPEDKEKLEAFAKALNIKEGSTEWVIFFDLSFISKGKLPSDIVERPTAGKYLPLLFRTVRGEKISKEKLKELIDLLNKS